jgi:hypothetical protein
MSEPELYTIHCVVEGEDTGFSVKIPNNETVDELKRVIQTDQFRTLAGIQANRLKLYLVSILTHDEEDNDIDYVAQAHEDMKKPQLPPELTNPTRKLIRIFKGTPPRDETLHIIVRRPPGRFSR